MLFPNGIGSCIQVYFLLQIGMMMAQAKDDPKIEKVSIKAHLKQSYFTSDNKKTFVDLEYIFNQRNFKLEKIQLTWLKKVDKDSKLQIDYKIFNKRKRSVVANGDIKLCGMEKKGTFNSVVNMLSNKLLFEGKSCMSSVIGKGSKFEVKEKFDFEYKLFSDLKEELNPPGNFSMCVYESDPKNCILDYQYTFK